MAEDEIPIGALSRRTGCNIETIRYYERIGVLPHPRRNGRYRCYRPDEIGRLVFVRRARELGFTLDEVRALLGLAAVHGDSVCAEVREIAAAHLAACERRLPTLPRWSASWPTPFSDATPESCKVVLSSTRCPHGPRAGHMCDGGAQMGASVRTALYAKPRAAIASRPFG